MTEIKNEDRISPRGERTVGKGLCLLPEKKRLSDFSFYKDAPLNNVLPQGARVYADGKMVLQGRLHFPAGYTCGTISLLRLTVDFSNKFCDGIVYAPSILHANQQAEALQLRPPIKK